MENAGNLSDLASEEKRDKNVQNTLKFTGKSIYIVKTLI